MALCADKGDGGILNWWINSTWTPGVNISFKIFSFFGFSFSAFIFARECEHSLFKGKIKKPVSGASALSDVAWSTCCATCLPPWVKSKSQSKSRATNQHGWKLWIVRLLFTWTNGDWNWCEFIIYFFAFHSLSVNWHLPCTHSGKKEETSRNRDTAKRSRGGPTRLLLKRKTLFRQPAS